jgi:hypothetical protein
LSGLPWSTSLSGKAMETCAIFFCLTVKDSQLESKCEILPAPVALCSFKPRGFVQVEGVNSSSERDHVFVECTKKSKL